MRRWLIYIFLLAATPVLGLVLFKGTDIAKLQPVEVVSLSIQEGQLQIQTDTGNMGIGSTCKQAWEDLQNAATGVVFLDTADYLTVTGDAQPYIEEMWEYLRPSCKICLQIGEGDWESLPAFLRTHEPSTTILQYRSGEKELPILIIQQGRMELVQ